MTLALSTWRRACEESLTRSRRRRLHEEAKRESWHVFLWLVLITVLAFGIYVMVWCIL